MDSTRRKLILAAPALILPSKVGASIIRPTRFSTTPVIEGVLASGKDEAGNIGVTLVSGVVNGELLLTIVSNDQGVSWDNETGWTKVINTASNRNGIAVFWRIADGTEPTSTVFDHTHNEADSEGYSMRISGANQLSPIDEIATVSIVASANTLVVTPPSANTSSAPLTLLVATGSSSLRTLSLSGGEFSEVIESSISSCGIIGENANPIGSNQGVNATTVWNISGIQFRIAND